jgi:diketogulonate reductase-like aldo/keto reductase
MGFSCSLFPLSKLYCATQTPNRQDTATLQAETNVDVFRRLTHLQDSATWYENEKECGQAILDFCKATGTPRSAIFYTTKLMINTNYEDTLKAIQYSLDACGLGYIDLYLIHGPLGGSDARKECWRAICDAQKEGKLKSIGVSCFGIRHLQEILAMGLAVPAINQVRRSSCCIQSPSLSSQIDLHPFMTRSAIVKFCQEHMIALEVSKQHHL